MSDSEDWIYEIVPQTQVDDMKAKMERVYDDESTTFTLVLSAPRSSAIQLCRLYDDASEGDILACIGVVQFVGNIVMLIEKELEDDGINPYED